jgi:hypothetical protein
MDIVIVTLCVVAHEEPAILSGIILSALLAATFIQKGVESKRYWFEMTFVVTLAFFFHLLMAIFFPPVSRVTNALCFGAGIVFGHFGTDLLWRVSFPD